MGRQILAGIVIFLVAPSVLGLYFYLLGKILDNQRLNHYVDLAAYLLAFPLVGLLVGLIKLAIRLGG